ncbi:MAG: radical SAM protein [Vulcanimicrobiota bacterium]
MKVLLVYCNSMLENALPVGLSQLSACLKAAGFTVELFDTTFYRYGPKSDMENRIEALQFPPCPLNFKPGNMEEDFNAAIESFQPDLIGLSVVEPTFHLGIRLLESARKIIKRNRIRVALGGVHAILAPETAIISDMIDYICISEGEHAFINLCQMLEKNESTNDIGGFWINQESQWKRNQKANLVNINDLPILDFTIYPESYLNKPMMGKLYRTISIETTRGCPYGCSYCGDKALRDLFRDKGYWYRQKRMDVLEKELYEYVNSYHPEFIYIMSESFLSGDINRVKKFMEVYKPFSLPFWFNTRPEDISEEKVKIIKEIGCKRISIGLEHGNELFRKQYLYRNYTNEKFLNACDILRSYQISFSVNVILGFPYETREMVFETINLLRNAKSDGISTHIYSPYHGSEMRELSIKEGMLDSNIIAEDFFQKDYLLTNTELSKDEILGLFRTIPLYIEMDKSEYDKIKIAEKLDSEGNKVFEELRAAYYAMKEWTLPVVYSKSTQLN